MKDCKFTSQEAIFYMFDLLEKKILVHPFEYRNISSRYKLWFFYGWWMPLYYLLSSQSNNLNLEDKDNHQSHKVSLKGKAANKLVFYKKYEKSEHVVLPKPFRLPQASLGKVLLSRRTARDFFNPMTIQELSNVLFWSFCKVKEYRDLQQSTYKISPENLMVSLFTVQEIYIAALNIVGLSAGVYHYDISKHRLDCIRNKVNPDDLVDIAQGQMFIKHTACVLFLSGVIDRWSLRYQQERAYRDLLVTTSRLAHRVLLYGTQMGLKLFETPAMKDGRVCKLLKLKPWKEEPLYLLGLGK